MYAKNITIRLKKEEIKGKTKTHQVYKGKLYHNEEAEMNVIGFIKEGKDFKGNPQDYFYLNNDVEDKNKRITLGSLNIKKKLDEENQDYDFKITSGAKGIEYAGMRFPLSSQWVKNTDSVELVFDNNIYHWALEELDKGGKDYEYDLGEQTEEDVGF